MTTMLANADGTVGDRFTEFYVARARGGTGLITSETVDIDAYTHNLSIGDRGFSAIYDDKFIPGLTRFVERLHAEGTKVSVQLHHSGSAMVMIDPARPPLAPSAIPYPGGQQPRALATSEIDEIIRAYGRAARRAVEAGFDAVDIHGGHGYLIAQFMSGYFNRRTDEYGGDLSGRLRFPIRVLKEVRSAIGNEVPIIFRFSAEEHLPDGRMLNESVAMAPVFVEAGADCLSITTGMHFDLTYTVAGFGMPKGLNTAASAAIKSVVEVPVLVTGKLSDPLVAESVLASGKADLVAVGRGMVADADWANKVREGRFDEIRACVACNQGCIGGLMVGLPFTCLVNPEAGREDEMRILPAKTPRRVFVAGGGPAGLETARVASERGHEVTLFETSDELGGQLRIGAIPPRKQELTAYLQYLSTQMRLLGVNVSMNRPLTPDLVKQECPDVVIVATGSRPVHPNLPGLDLEHVVTAQQVLTGKASVGQRVVIAGGGQVGCETAEFLCKYGKHVTLIELRPELAQDEVPVARKMLLESLKKTATKVLTSTELVEIGKGYVVIQNGGEQQVLEGVDHVVLALGAKAQCELAEALSDSGCEVHVIGDAKQPSSALQAIAAAAQISRQI